MKCRCRNCGSHYDEAKSRADYKGFCSKVCQHEKAWTLGYRKPTKSYNRYGAPVTRVRSAKTEYEYLAEAKMIGSTYWE